MRGICVIFLMFLTFSAFAENVDLRVFQLGNRAPYVLQKGKTDCNVVAQGRMLFDHAVKPDDELLQKDRVKRFASLYSGSCSHNASLNEDESSSWVQWHGVRVRDSSGHTVPMHVDYKAYNIWSVDGPELLGEEWIELRNRYLVDTVLEGVYRMKGPRSSFRLVAYATPALDDVLPSNVDAFYGFLSHEIRQRSEMDDLFYARLHMESLLDEDEVDQLYAHLPTPGNSEAKLRLNWTRHRYPLIDSLVSVVRRAGIHLSDEEERGLKNFLEFRLVKLRFRMRAPDLALKLAEALKKARNFGGSRVTTRLWFAPMALKRDCLMSVPRPDSGGPSAFLQTLWREKSHFVNIDAFEEDVDGNVTHVHVFDPAGSWENVMHAFPGCQVDILTRENHGFHRVIKNSPVRVQRIPIYAFVHLMMSRWSVSDTHNEARIYTYFKDQQIAQVSN